jgi:hypothetical protein
MRKLSLCAILAAAAGGLAIVGVVTQSSPTPANAATTVASTAAGHENVAGTVTPPFGRDFAIAYVRGLTLITRRIDSVDAKLTTWGQWQKGVRQSETEAGIESQRLVWVVSVAGNIDFPANHGTKVSWAAFVLDATTGKPLGANAGNQQPGFYSTLTDLAAR